MSVSKFTRRAKMKVSSEAARKKRISKLVKASEVTHPVKIRGKTHHLPVIRVPLEFPLYRVDSNRTRDAQRLMVDEGIVEEGTFEKSHDSKEVQQAQHEILCEDGESNPERDKSLVEVFEEEELDESKPFNMTSDGRLQNGNTRAATIRELTAKGQGKVSFAKPWVVVLPEDLSDEDLTDMEFDMQIGDPSIGNYDWIQNTSYMKKQTEVDGMTDKQIVNFWKDHGLEQTVGVLMAMRDELDAILDEMDQGERIEEYRTKPIKQLLITYATRVACATGRGSKKPSRRQKQLIRSYLRSEFKIAVSGVESEGMANRRLNKLISEVMSNEGLEVVSEVIEGIVPEKKTGNTSETLGIPVNSGYKPNLKEASNLTPEKSVELVKEIEDKIAVRAADKEDKKDRDAMVRRTKQASRIILNAARMLDNRDDYNKNGVENHIKNIRNALERFEEWLDEDR